MLRIKEETRDRGGNSHAEDRGGDSYAQDKGGDTR
jgi:hypothetical protein